MNIRIYSPDKYKRYVQRMLKGQYVRQDATVTVVDNGIIAIDKKTHGFGVFDANGKFVEESCQIRGRTPQYIPRVAKNIINDDSTVVFFGNVYPHFGHFLLEHMNRAWALVDEKYRDAKIVLVNNLGVNPVPKYITDLVSMMGMEIMVVSETTQFRRVIVPSQGFCSRWYHCPEFPRAFDYIAGTVRGAGYDKVYVSRTALKTGRTIGEEKIQRIFEKNGFRVVCPETLPLAKQIAIMKNCRVLAGCAGTALHLALFMPRGGHVIQIKRNRRPKDNAHIQNNICRAKDMDLSLIWGSVETTKSGHGAVGPQVIGPTKYLKQFFDENGFVYDDSDMVLDGAVMTEYKNAMREYRKTSGGVFVHTLKVKFVKFSSCVIPGRERRGAYRAYMKKRLNLKKGA